MKNKIITVALIVLIGLTTMGGVINAATDPELEELRRQETINTVIKNLDINIKRLEEKNLTKYALELCGATPVITSSSPVSNVSFGSPYQSWQRCVSGVLTTEENKIRAEKGLRVAVDIIERLGVMRKVEQECGTLPTKPSSNSNIEIEKFRIKSGLWAECSVKATENARKEAKKSGLFDEVAYIQQRSKEFNLEGKLSDICLNTPKFINLTRDQLVSYSEILEIQNWYECARKNITRLVADAEYEKKVETQSLEKVQETLNEAKRLLEAQRQRGVKGAPIPKPIQQVEKPSVKATSSSEIVTSAETPIEPSKETGQPSAVRKIFRNFFNFFRSSR